MIVHWLLNAWEPLWLQLLLSLEPPVQLQRTVPRCCSMLRNEAQLMQLLDDFARKKSAQLHLAETVGVERSVSWSRLDPSQQLAVAHRDEKTVERCSKEMRSKIVTFLTISITPFLTICCRESIHFWKHQSRSTIVWTFQGVWFCSVWFWWTLLQLVYGFTKGMDIQTCIGHFCWTRFTCS